MLPHTYPSFSPPSNDNYIDQPRHHEHQQHAKAPPVPYISQKHCRSNGQGRAEQIKHRHIEPRDKERLESQVSEGQVCIANWIRGYMYGGGMVGTSNGMEVAYCGGILDGVDGSSGLRGRHESVIAADIAGRLLEVHTACEEEDIEVEGRPGQRRSGADDGEVGESEEPHTVKDMPIGREHPMRRMSVGVQRMMERCLYK